MPIYRGTIYKQVENGGVLWRNVYDINESNALEALDVLNAIQIHEVSVTSTHVYFVRNHVVNVANKNDQMSGNPGVHGSLADIPDSQPLPLFLTIEVVFSDNLKRPERKWLRGWFQTAHVELGHWGGEIVDFVNTNYAQPVLAHPQYVGPGGEHPTSATVNMEYANRQLGWHRRHRPGFKRGWVPA